MAKLRPEIQKLCVVRTFWNIEKLVRVTTKLEKVLGEFKEISYEPLKEEQEGVSETMMESSRSRDARYIREETIFTYSRLNEP
jgi:hypothetical protein